MSFINVNLADKKTSFASFNSEANSLSFYNTQAYTKPMPSIFTYYTPSCCNFYVPSFNNFWNLFNFIPTFNFVPQFNFKPQLNLFSNLTNFSNYSPAINFDLGLNSSKLSLSDVVYNAKKGNELANAARNNAKGFQGDCALYVRLALEKCGLGTGERGDGYEYARILSRNKNFKEISTTDLDLSDLPAGCILVYGKGTSGYSSTAGHVEITLGNGQAASDGVTNNIRQGARVFVPV